MKDAFDILETMPHEEVEHTEEDPYGSGSFKHQNVKAAMQQENK